MLEITVERGSKMTFEIGSNNGKVQKEGQDTEMEMMKRSCFDWLVIKKLQYCCGIVCF